MNQESEFQVLADKALRFAELSGYARGDYRHMEARLVSYARKRGADEARKDIASTTRSGGERVRLGDEKEFSLGRLRELARNAARWARVYRSKRYPEAGMSAYGNACEAARVAGYMDAVLRA